MADEVDAPLAERQDLAGIFSRYRRYLPLILVTFVACLALAGLATAFMSRRYTASASLQYDPQEVNLTTGAKPATSDAARDAAVDAQIDLVSSLAVADGVVRDLNLVSDPELQKAAAQFAGSSPAQRLDAMGTALLNNLRARRSGTTNLFEIAYTAKDPVKAAEIANGFVHSYMREQVAQKTSQTGDQSTLYRSQLQSLQKQVEQANVAVAQYKAAHGLDSDVGTNPSWRGGTLTEQQISALRDNIATTKSEQAVADAQYAAAEGQMRGSGGAGSVSDVLASPVIAQLKQQRATAASKVADLSAHYGPKYPALVSANEELTVIDRQIAEETQKITSNLRAQSQVSHQKTASLEASLADARAHLMASNASGVGLATLQSNADTAKALYEAFLASSKTITVSQSLVQPDATISSLATPPLEPSSPNVAINLFLGGLLGLALGVGIAFLRDRWTVGLNTVDDIERYLGQNYLNSLPTLASSIDDPKTKDPMDAVVVHPLSRFAEAFRTLGASLLLGRGANSAKVIGITSALPKEGKTTTSVALARVLAMGGQKVALMDVDLRRRSVTSALAPDASIGVIDVVEGRATLAQAMLLDEPSGMRFLPLAKNAHLSKSPFQSEAFADLMAQLRSQFDVVIMDTAPILAVVDTRMLLPHIDELALLARWRVTPIKAIRAAVHQVEAVGGRVFGVSMSLVNAKVQAQSGYGDPSYYYSDMKEYYSE